MSTPKWTHLNEKGEARMVDVGEKPVTARVARAQGSIHMPARLVRQLKTLKKGNALEVARLAGIMAAKRTGDWIPLCHNLPLDHIELWFDPSPEQEEVRVLSEVRCQGRTGVEMEALTAVSSALLTLYDMAKALCREMEIGPIRLVHKEGGKSGVWKSQRANASRRVASESGSEKDSK